MSIKELIVINKPYVMVTFCFQTTVLCNINVRSAFYGKCVYVYN